MCRLVVKSLYAQEPMSVVSLPDEPKPDRAIRRLCALRNCRGAAHRSRITRLTVLRKLECFGVSSMHGSGRARRPENDCSNQAACAPRQMLIMECGPEAHLGLEIRASTRCSEARMHLVGSILLLPSYRCAAPRGSSRAIVNLGMSRVTPDTPLRARW